MLKGENGGGTTTPKRYYTIRMAESMIEQLKEIAARITRETGMPVEVAPLCRKYIEAGIKRDAEETGARSATTEAKNGR